MAGLRRNKKLAAYVLLESIFAMIIIMICFSIFLSTYNTVTTGSGTRIKLLAGIRVDSELARTIDNQDFLDQSIPCGIFRLEKTIRTFHGNENLLQVTIRAISVDGQLLAIKNGIAQKPQ